VQFDELLPRYLTFLRGVVDSEDLPLNVGREILQKSKMLNVINKRLVRKSLDMFRDIEKNATAYNTFWGNFGRYLKVRQTNASVASARTITGMAGC
jgi:molecular chaperone HtpG